MRLQAVEINNFLSFGSFHWSGVDPQLNLIVGPNGGGKTNFGRALRAAVDAFDHQRRVRWAQAANAASNSPAYRITLDLCFTDDWERRLFLAWVAAAICDQQTFDQLRSAQDQRIVNSSFQRDDLIRLSDVLPQILQPDLFAPFFQGRLVVDYGGDYSWSISYESQPSERVPFRWNLDGAGLNGVQFGPRKPNAQGYSALSLLANLLSDVGWKKIVELVHGTGDQIPLVKGKRALAYLARATPYLASPAVRRPQTLLSPHRELERLTGSPLEQNREYNGFWLFGELLRRAFVFTENIRLAPAQPYGVPDLTSAGPVDLSNGEHLGLDLFLKKNGDQQKRNQFSEVGNRFRAITGNGFGFDIVVAPQLDEPSATGLAAQPSQNAAAIELRVRNETGEFPLAFSGAGIAEALFVSTVLTNIENRIVLLDEPASNLHPTMQARLVREIRNQPHCQFFVITHSAAMLPGDSIDRASRFARNNGCTVRTFGTAQHVGVGSVEEEMLRRGETKALLFANGVILVEGYEELNAFSLWVGSQLESANIAVLPVNSDKSFAKYIRFLLAYGIPWAVLCDGKIIGDRTPPRIVEQLRYVGIKAHLPRPLQFCEMAEHFKHFGIFTLARKSDDELADSLPIIHQHRIEAEAATGKTLGSGRHQSKPAIVTYIADHYPCPTEFASITNEILAWLDNGEALRSSAQTNPGEDKMETQGEGKSYQGLPSVPPEVATFVTDTLIPQLAGLGTLDDMLTRIDEDINGLEQANPQLAGLVRGTVEGLFGGVGDRLPGERERAYLRVFGFFNAMTLLRALDMAWRRQQPP